ncbi:MAG: response regulator [Acidimicrobiales bacterium]|nr:response regulator [Acidimicrobiales bacterium]
MVEDDRKFAAVLQRHLHATGIRTRLAGSGDSALRAVRDLDVAALVLDIMIPHPDGIEVCRQLRRDHWRGLIVAMSARTGPIHEAAISDAGADVFLAKPFPLDELTSVLIAGPCTEPGES